MKTAIADRPPKEMYAPGVEIDCQCARCGSSCDFVHCEDCDDGFIDCYEEDPLWYDPDDFRTCETCHGLGGWQACLSGEKWCIDNPLPGREDVPRGKIEWFTIETPNP